MLARVSKVAIAVAALDFFDVPPMCAFCSVACQSALDRHHPDENTGQVGLVMARRCNGRSDAAARQLKIQWA
jgi:hypothetical protein